MPSATQGVPNSPRLITEANAKICKASPTLRFSLWIACTASASLRAKGCDSTRLRLGRRSWTAASGFQDVSTSDCSMVCCSLCSGRKICKSAAPLYTHKCQCNSVLATGTIVARTNLSAALTPKETAPAALRSGQRGIAKRVMRPAMT